MSFNTDVLTERAAGGWPRERFAAYGIDYLVAAQPKSDIYLTLLPLLNSGRVELLDHPRLTAQLCALERRTARGGRDSIDHAPGAHDDVVNAAAGAIVLAAQRTMQAIPLVAPIIVSLNEPIVPGQSATAAFYKFYGRNAHHWN